MRRRKVVWPLAAAFLMAVTPSLAQNPAGDSVSARKRAEQEVEGVMADTVSLTNKQAYVKVSAKADDLLWRSDPARARKALRELWAWVNAQGDEGFEKEWARTVVLKVAFVRDPKLAFGLLEETRAGSAAAVASDAAAGAQADTRRLNDLASAVMEGDPPTAAKLLERSLSEGFSPANMSLLSQLGKKDWALSDGIAGRILDVQRVGPTDRAMTAMYVLSEYVFAPQRNAGPAAASGEALRRQYFFAGEGVLARGLRESEERRAQGRPAGAGFEAFYEAQLAGTLAALAKRYAPERATELGEVGRRLLAALPPPQAEMARYAAERAGGGTFKPDRPTPSTDISVAIAGGDFNEARRLLEKVEPQDVRRFFAYQIATGEFKSLMAKSDLGAATVVARGVELPQARAYMLAQVAKAAYAKDDLQFARQLLAEARSALSNLQCSDKSALATFSLASAAAPVAYDESLDLIIAGVNCVNSLDVRAGGEKERSDTGESIYTPALQNAFSAVGSLNLSDALSAAGRIGSRPVRLLARLSASEVWLDNTGQKRAAVKPEPVAGGPRVH